MGTVHLTGDFGTVREPVDADFPYFGQTIRVHPNASDLAFADVMRRARGIDFGDFDVNDPASWTPEQMKLMLEANDAAMDAIAGQIHPDDLELFMRTARANGQQTADLMRLSNKITEAVAGFPTTRSSGSATGRPTTKLKSARTSSSLAQRAPRRRRTGSTPPSPSDARTALTLLQGRPDLQEFVVQGQEAAAQAG